MDRAAIGLGSVFLHLKAEINWYQLFHELIDGFDVKALDKRQKAALKEAGLKTAALDALSSGRTSMALHVLFRLRLALRRGRSGWPWSTRASPTTAEAPVVRQ